MPMSIRLSELEVQVGRFVYAFEECDEADGFQACVSAVNASYCDRKIRTPRKHLQHSMPRVKAANLAPLEGMTIMSAGTKSGRRGTVLRFMPPP